MFSKIIRNAQVVDGTGTPPRTADVAIDGDKIVQVGNLAGASAQQEFDGTGKYLAPGFIDIQNHSDVYWLLFDNPSAESMLCQGITSIIVGNCGASLAPILGPDALLSIQKWHDLAGINVNWATVDEYLTALSKLGLGVNVGTLVGYSTLRRAIVGDESRPMDVGELASVHQAIRSSIQAGAFGVSSGLSYTHESSITTEELVALANVVKGSSAFLSVHLRSEGDRLVEAVEEVLGIAVQSGVSLKISHLKASGKENWPKLPDAVAMVELAVKARANVAFDVYPYNFVWQVLYVYLPKWAYQGGRSSMIANLKDPVTRAKILDYLAGARPSYADLTVTNTSMPMNVNGKTLGEVAGRLGTTAEEALLTLLENGGTEVMVFDESMDIRQVAQLVCHPLSMVVTDGAGFPLNWKHGLVHPRSFGAMPKLLEMSLSENLLPIEEAVHKITGAPAQLLGLKGRGKIAPGYAADLVLFGSDVHDTATTQNPYRFPMGIQLVVVNGKVALEGGQLTADAAARASGRVLRKGTS